MEMFKAIFDAERWASVPFGFWAGVMFVFGSMVGSFLNVCIYRMPLGLSVVSPPSHCPHCKYSIPWFLNADLVVPEWQMQELPSADFAALFSRGTVYRLGVPRVLASLRPAVTVVGFGVCLVSGRTHRRDVH